MSEKKILIIGSSNMDLSVNMYKLPEPNQTVTDDGGVAYVPGGNGSNAAVAFAKLGAESILCTKLGADFHGQRLYQYYKKLGVNTAYIKVDNENPTGIALVLREGDGTNRTVVYPGANSTLTVDNINSALSSEPDAVYIGFEIPFQLALSAARLAYSRNIPVFIDAAPANRDYPLEQLPPVEIFSPNEAETYEYTGITPLGADASLRAALALYKRVKCKYIIIKQGERGAFVYDGKHYYMVPSIRFGKTVDTTAAGDAFTAATVIEYLRTNDIRSAVKYGTAAGAITVTRPGASSSIPTEEEVRALLEKEDI